MKRIYLLLLTTLLSIPSFAQNAGDTKNLRFYDDLLDRLVGKWDVAAVAHEGKFTLDLEAAWVMNHQYLHVHFKSHEVVPWLNVPFEGEFFFGYNPTNKRYTVHEMTVHGDDGPYEGFCYAHQTGNEFKLVKKWAGSGNATVQRFTWEPHSNSWDIDMRLLVNGKESESQVDMKLATAKQ
ncbi:MAG: hypothetical protein ABI863_23440 [Ginsengibacter sp.]